MILPDALNSYPNALVRLFEELEYFLISDISRRVKKAAYLTETAETQTRTLRELGSDLTDVKAKIAECCDLSADIASAMFDRVINESFNKERSYAVIAGKTLNLTTAKLNIIQTSVHDIRGEFLSLTGSLGMAGLPLEDAYHHAVNTAYLQVATGGADYISAIRRQVRVLAENGLQVIDYESGHRDHADVAVRRAVITGLSKSTQAISLMNALELGTNLVETSAHAGARPSHALWQGRVFRINNIAVVFNEDGSVDYPDFYAATGYGTGEGLGGYNCRHAFWPFFPGMTRMYTDEQLENIDPKPFFCTLDGKYYTAWEASQKQRSIERAVRKQKRLMAGFDAAGDKDALLRADSKLKQQLDIYKQFSAEAKLLKQPERLGVVVVGKGGRTQLPKSLPGGADDKNYLTNAAGRSIIEVDVRRIPRDGTPNSITQTTRANGGIVRTYYGEDGFISKQFHNNDHGSPVAHPYGAHMHDYDWLSKDKKPEKKPRPLTDEEGFENGDLL